MSVRAILSAAAAALLLAAASAAPAWAGHGARHGVAGGHHAGGVNPGYRRAARAAFRRHVAGRQAHGGFHAGHHHRHAFFPRAGRHAHWRHDGGGISERRFFPQRFHRARWYGAPAYVAFPGSGFGTVAGATSYAPLYNRPGPICF